LGILDCDRRQSDRNRNGTVNTLFMGFVGAVAVAAALAFGLGGRGTAAQIGQGWYQAAQEAKPKIVQAGEAAQQQTQESADQLRRVS
jgi:hypothetical protein